MKNFLLGFYHLANAPAIVNKKLLRHLPRSRYRRQYSGSGLRRRLDCYTKIVFSKRIIISGIFVSRSEVRLIKLLGKRFVYIMHGSARMETGHDHPTEQLILASAHRIVSVSAVHAAMIKNEYPQYAHKVVTWYNGVDWDEIDRIKASINDADRDPNKIVLFGGGRFMKGNLAVCQAVQKLNETRGLNLHVDVYGTYSDDDLSPQISHIPCVNYKPLIPAERINYELAKARLFVANSSFDTFNLALMDAIGLGCSVLFSQHVGAKDVIAAASERDIIRNVNDVDELMDKIEYVLSHPNNERLNASIDREATSWAVRADQLDDIVRSL